MQKAKAAVAGSLTVIEARIVHREKQTGKERASKHRKRVINATYNHSSIVLSLKRQINTLKEENTRLYRDNKAHKAVDEEKTADLTQLVDFIESNPNIAAVRRQYDYSHASGDEYGLLNIDRDLKAYSTVQKHLKKRATKAAICKPPRVTEGQRLQASKLLKF